MFLNIQYFILYTYTSSDLQIYTYAHRQYRYYIVAIDFFHSSLYNTYISYILLETSRDPSSKFDGCSIVCTVVKILLIIPRLAFFWFPARYLLSTSSASPRELQISFISYNWNERGILFHYYFISSTSSRDK